MLAALIEVIVICESSTFSDGHSIAMALIGLRGMDCRQVEVREMLLLLSKIISTSCREVTLNAENISCVLQGLEGMIGMIEMKGMNGCEEVEGMNGYEEVEVEVEVEVQAVISALSDRIEDCDEAREKWSMFYTSYISNISKADS